MRRRALLAGLALAPAAAHAAPVAINFRILRGGSAVGTHAVRFREEGALLVAESEVRITVRLAGFTVYRYAHDTTERWQGARLMALTSRIDRNGTPGFCEARAEANALALRGTAGEARLPAEAAPLTWWRLATLNPGVPLFDPRRGEPVSPVLQRSPQAGGTQIRLIGGEGAEVLYDAAGAWIGFSTTGEDGSAVRYERA
jgi:hypothetical protein